ncbi:MAG: peptide ABC transporter substrate-binding protein, partial [Gammaproteobacteria bacterium]|nr:peptide ABC transporter substrate-binding protein [Gammaproteobacteria bacterium]
MQLTMATLPRALACTRRRVLLATAALALSVSALVADTARAQSDSKTIIVVLAEEPSTLDGCNGNTSATGRVVRNNIVEGLTEIDPSDGSLKPRLAVSWERVDDLTWRFELRPGVKFHDGAPFNAETATKAISRTLDTELDCETRQKFFGTLKVKGHPVDELTLELKTDKPVPILPTYMGSLMLSSPNTPMDKATNAPIGTGAYKFVEWKPGQYIVVARNDDWWGEKPQAEAARYIWRTESAVRAAMVEVGEGDIAPNIAVQDATNPKTDFSYPNSE